jgi:uncharacterized membrane protein HdeD (DUF308 family)
VLRRAVLIFGCLLLVLGAYLCTKSVLCGGIQTLLAGALLILGTVFERWRYNNKNASSDGEWQATGERFVDPETGKHMEVWYDPQSGERQYRELRN